MIGFKGLPSGIIVGLVCAGLAFLITGMPSAAAIFGVAFGGAIYAVVRYQLLYAKPATSGFGGSSDDGDTSTYDSSYSSWMSSTSSDPSPSDTDCSDNSSDSGSDSGGSCDSGGDSGGD